MIVCFHPSSNDSKKRLYRVRPSIRRRRRTCEKIRNEFFLWDETGIPGDANALGRLSADFGDGLAAADRSFIRMLNRYLGGHDLENSAVFSFNGLALMIPQVLRPPPYLSSTSLDGLLADITDSNIPGAFLRVLFIHDIVYDAWPCRW